MHMADSEQMLPKFEIIMPVSPMTCVAIVQKDLIPLLRELGIGIVPYSPLGRGFLTGSIASLADLSPDDRRK